MTTFTLLYVENGKVQTAKVTRDGVERVVFNKKLKPGEWAVITGSFVKSFTDEKPKWPKD